MCNAQAQCVLGNPLQAENILGMIFMIQLAQTNIKEIKDINLKDWVFCHCNFHNILPGNTVMSMIY